jgi:hypothetical protein
MRKDRNREVLWIPLRLVLDSRWGLAVFTGDRHLPPAWKLNRPGTPQTRAYCRDQTPLTRIINGVCEVPTAVSPFRMA